jgi:imidazolonepropionase-like amidohydrolase
LDLLAEMQYVVSAFAEVDPQEVLRMGTLTGAEALGRDAEVGSLTPGKLANVIAVPIERNSAGAAAVLESLFAASAKASHVWIRGAIV